VSDLAELHELRPLAVHAPEAFESLRVAFRAAQRAVERGLAELVRSRIAALLGAEPEGSRPDAARTPREQACLDLTEQFVVYVPGIGEAQRSAVAAHLGTDGLDTLVDALYVFDATERLRLALGRLFEPGDRRPVAVSRAAAELPLGEATAGVHAAAMRLPAIDPVTTELVRLHCAAYHDCKT